MTNTTELNGQEALPKILSVDDHVIEPAHTWQHWLPEKFRERGPRVERHKIGPLRYDMKGGRSLYTFDLDVEDGTWSDVWFFESVRRPQSRETASVGIETDDRWGPMTYDEMRPGCYDPKARAQDMIANHVDGSLCFPTLPRFCGQTFLEAEDKELGLACVRAYNDFMIEEWCGEGGGVLIPLCIVPLWDVELACQEVRRNANRGCRAVCFSELPDRLGLPSIHSGKWDPFFATCEETNTAVFIHIGSSSTMQRASNDAPTEVNTTLSFNGAMLALSDWLFSGVLLRFPRLKVALAEGQIGWIPYVLERADDVYMTRPGLRSAMPEAPSFYFRQSIFCCFFRDAHGVKSLDDIGIDNVTFETDYPHTDSTWPNTLQLVHETMGHLPPDDIYKVLRGNAERLLDMS